MVLIVHGVENLEKTPLGEQGCFSLQSLPSPLHSWLPSPPDFPFSHSLHPSHTFSFFSLPVRGGQRLPDNLHVAMQSNNIRLLLLPYKLSFTGAGCPINRSHPAAVPKRRAGPRGGMGALGIAGAAPVPPREPPCAGHPWASVLMDTS